MCASTNKSLQDRPSRLDYVFREIILQRQSMTAASTYRRDTVAALAAEDPLEERSLRFHEDFEFTSVEEDSTAILRTAAVHEHDTRVLFFLEGGAALGAA